MKLDDLRKNRMMAHLLGALERGEDPGHYGRLVFAIIARHFLAEREVVELLAKSPHFSEKDARALVLQVSAHDYNPPSREKILQWQKEQEFPICPDNDDPDSCNPYRNLEFPKEVYDRISDYYVKKV